jgi:hypothetical protein
MKIVPTPTPQKQKMDLDYLATRKQELSGQIQQQKEQISTSAKHLFSPATLSSYVVKTFTKGLNIVDGVMLGFKMMRGIRRMFKR